MPSTRPKRFQAIHDAVQFERTPNQRAASPAPSPCAWSFASGRWSSPRGPLAFQGIQVNAESGVRDLYQAALEMERRTRDHFRKLAADLPAYTKTMRLSPRCYAVTGLGYSPPWCVNAGFITGDELTLVVDTGGNTLAAQTIHGYAAAARPGNQLCVVNTEKHFDHIGGNGFFREQGIDVWGHAGIARTDAEFQAEIAEFNEAIPNASRRARGEASAFFHGTRLVNPNCRIHEDTRFSLGGSQVEILLAPGHTATNLSVWVPEDGVLYTGDCLISEYLPNLDAGTREDWQVWLASLERIEALKPAMVVAGHGPVARGAQVQAIVDAVRRVLVESIARGFSPTAERSGRSARPT